MPARIPPFSFEYVLKRCCTLIELNGWAEPVKYQILSIWTTYCIWYQLNVDTYTYDSKLHELYFKITDKLGSQITIIDELKTFDNFDTFVCQYLV